VVCPLKAANSHRFNVHGVFGMDSWKSGNRTFVSTKAVLEEKLTSARIWVDIRLNRAQTFDMS